MAKLSGFLSGRGVGLSRIAPGTAFTCFGDICYREVDGKVLSWDISRKRIRADGNGVMGMVPRYLVDFSLEDLEVRETDFLIVGSGIAGLFTALKGATYGEVVVLTKRKVEDSNTEFAQGGIAVAIDEGDSPLLHLEDTLQAGAGLCDGEAVSTLVTEGPSRVEELIQMGANFDQVGGSLALTREGAHSRRRILHASGDATGEEVRRTLLGQCRRLGLPIYEDTFVVDVLKDENGRCGGVLALSTVTGRLLVYRAKVTVLATGGLGQLYKNTTNPEVATGDGIAAAYRAGVEVMDMEFFQFHPTALNLEGAPRFLISEAVRGEGAFLRNCRGERFMSRYHPLAELAPRDVVALAIWREMEKEGTDHVFLDLTHMDGENLKKRFPTISRTCAKYGLDLAVDYLPVAPAAHYMMGGIRTNINGETNLAGLYASGEAACNGVHGANRLASNSLLDGLVFGHRIIQASVALLAHPLAPLMKEKNPWPQGEISHLDPESLISQIQETMWEYVGLQRSAKGLDRALSTFRALAPALYCGRPEVRRMEGANLLLLAILVTQAAAARTESRGAHYRVDYTQRNNQVWSKHIVQSI